MISTAAPTSSAYEIPEFTRRELDSILTIVLAAHGVQPGVHVYDVIEGRVPIPLVPPGVDPFAAARPFLRIPEPGADGNGRIRANQFAAAPSESPARPPAGQVEPPVTEHPVAEQAVAEQPAAEHPVTEQPMPPAAEVPLPPPQYAAPPQYTGPPEYTAPPAPEPAPEPPPLSAEEREQLDRMDAGLYQYLDAHAIPEHKTQAYEMKAHGQSVEEIAEHFGKHRGTVYRWIAQVADAHGTRMREQRPVGLMAELCYGYEKHEAVARRWAKKADNDRARVGYLNEARQARKQRADLLLRTGLIQVSQQTFFYETYPDRQTSARRARRRFDRLCGGEELAGREQRDATVCDEAHASMTGEAKQAALTEY